MRLLIQRVLGASVSIGGVEKSAIDRGLLVLVGIEAADGEEDIAWLVQKLVHLRIFDDAAGVMNLDVVQAKGKILVVSQFTLMASTRRGNRPSYIRAAAETISQPLYERFLHALGMTVGYEVPCGAFGADMQVALVNDGPVTIWLDSKSRE